MKQNARRTAELRRTTATLSSTAVSPPRQLPQFDGWIGVKATATPAKPVPQLLAELASQVVLLDELVDSLTEKLLPILGNDGERAKRESEIGGSGDSSTAKDVSASAHRIEAIRARISILIDRLEI